MFARLLSAAGLAALEGEVMGMVQRARRRAILLAIAAVLWIVVLGFVLAALTVWLSDWVGPLYACLIVAGGFALIALILHAIAASQKRRRPPPASLASLFDEAMTGQDAGNSTNYGLLAIVTVAGYLLGRNLFRR